MQQQLPPPVGLSHSGPGPLPGLIWFQLHLCVVYVGARVRGSLMLVVCCEFYGLPRAVVMLLAPRPVYCYGPEHLSLCHGVAPKPLPF